MIIDVIVEDDEVNNIAYPCFMSSGDLVVLFSRYRTGTVIKASLAHDIGEHSDSWNMETFRPIHGKIIIEQRIVK